MQSILVNVISTYLLNCDAKQYPRVKYLKRLKYS